METALQRYGFDTSDPLAVWLNAAVHDIEAMYDWPFFEEGAYQFVAQAGVQEIALPADFLKVITLWDSDHQCKLQRWDYHKFKRDIQSPLDQGSPEIYTILNLNQIILWRVPLTNTNFELVYQATTADMVNPTDVPTSAGIAWPNIMHYPIVVRAAATALMAENEEDRAKSALDEFQRMILNCMGKFSERELDEPLTVEDAQGYAGATLPLRGIAGW